MIKLIIWFNLRKLIVNKEMEILYFVEKQAKHLRVDLKTLTTRITKLKEKEQTDKIIVEVSKLETKLQQATHVQDTLKKFELEKAYFEGLIKTIKQNFWKF